MKLNSRSLLLVALFVVGVFVMNYDACAVKSAVGARFIGGKFDNLHSLKRATRIRRMTFGESVVFGDVRHSGDILWVNEVLKFLSEGSKLFFGDFRDVYGNTPLHVAVQRGRIKSVRELLSYSVVDVNAVNACGDTSLHVAVRYNRSDIVKHLLAHPDTDVNAKNLHGDTPLHIAVKYNRMCILGCLLSHPRIDVMVENETGIKPEDMIKTGSQLRIFKRYRRSS